MQNEGEDLAGLVVGGGAHSGAVNDVLGEARCPARPPNDSRLMDMATPIALPQRPGPAPEVVGPAPHAQRSQIPPVMLQEELWSRMRALPYTYMAPTLVSVTHARALHLPENVGSAPPNRFQGGREFTHLHPHHDGSLHLSLPNWARDAATRSGWGVPHPVQNSFLVFGPRDRVELEVVWHLVQVSYLWAMGEVSAERK